MTELSVSTIERRSGIEKQPDETLSEYLNRVGKRTDLPAEDITAIVNHANWQQFGSGADSSSTPDPPIEEFLAAVESIGETTTAETATETETELQERQQEETRSQLSLSPPTQDNEETGNTDGSPVRIPIAIAAGLLVLAAVVSGAIVLNENTGLLASTDSPDPAPDDSTTPPADTNNTESEDNEESETTVVTSAAEAEGALDVTDMRVDGDDPEEEFIELTNVGEVTLDMSDWTVRDRENGGAVDAGGVDPATFPDGFTLEPGESVRLYTTPGEDTEDTIHWGYYDRQNWHSDGDVIIVLDGDGNEVLRYEYGSPP